MMGNGFGMGGGWIVMIVFWVVLIGLVVWAVSALLPGPRPNEQDRLPTAVEILDRRFARGELDVEQYQRAREKLLGHTTGRR